MHIKKLEISGFKSFVDRTVVHFDHDVIGIVGPNGCGKSNIVDALRWCMGEQSAKHLRGRSMEDVIFSGSESRPAHGLAEVVLTFDNSDAEYARSLPIEYRDFAEIAVCRRLYRDGTSEYKINGALVRLRDITELFLGTGVGTKAYSIVEQGRIGQIVSARPQDRRMFLEEAAGITKYRQRRKQAERKLDLSKQNLLRLRDIVSEIDRSRSSLRRQATKAERFIRYREEVEELSLHQASHRLLELIVVQRCQQSEHSSLSAQSVTLREAVVLRDEHIEKARSRASEVEESAQKASQQTHDADNSVVALRAEYQRGQDRLVHLRERLANSSRIREELVGRSEHLAEEERGLSERQEKLALEETALGQAAGCQDTLLIGLQREEQSTTENVQGLRRTVGKLTSQIATDEVRIAAIAERTQTAAQRGALLDSQSQELEQATATLQGRVNETEPKRSAALEVKSQTAESRKQMKAQLSELSPQLVQSERTLRDERRQFESRSSRLDVLQELQRRMEGVKSGAKAVVTSGDPAVRGLFAERLDVPAELTDAVAGLLGDRLETVVSTDPASLLPLLEGIRTGKKGRVSVIASAPAHVAGRRRPSVKQQAGVVGVAADLVSFAAADEALVRMMMGDAVIVREAAEVLALSRQLGVTAVALDGTVASPLGILTGGSIAAPQIDRRRELTELSEELQQRQQQLEVLESQHQELADRSAALKTGLEEAGRAAHQAELTYLGADKDLSRLRGELSATEKRLARLVEERASLQKNLEHSDEEGKLVQRSLQEASSAVGAEQEKLAEAEEAMAASKQKVAEQSSVVTGQKVRLAQVTEQRDAVVASLQRVRDTFRSTEAQAQELEQGAREASASLGETAAKLINGRIAQRAAEVKAQSSRKELAQVRTSLEEIREALGAGEDELRALRTEQTGVDGKLGEFEMKLQKLSLEHEHLLAGVAEKFRGLDLRRVVGDYHARPAPDDDHRRRIDELGKLIDRMGSVNLDAEAEFEDAENRFVQLSGQVIDIEKAMAELEVAIEHMDRESTRRFKDTFKTVNVLFTAMFQRMFGGGHAKLSLTEPDNLLETGIDIVAQPPGKKLGTVELMSGGEKALTAASLIFAIFQHRPSPFCVLDEVDAPLDEANVSRYNEAIRSMTSKSQFIVITHIKATMQSVDLLYGVTMGEPGVSRVVSVKVNEHAQSRSKLDTTRTAPKLAAADEGSQVA